DAEWAHVAWLIPPAKPGGNKRTVDIREVMNGGHVCPEHGLPVARAAQGPAAQEYGARLSDLVELRRHARSHPPRALCRLPRASRTRSEPDRCHHRQPEREKRRKRGPCIDPPGYDAGKKIKGKKRHVLVDTLGLLLHAIVHPADIQDP